MWPASSLTLLSSPLHVGQVVERFEPEVRHEFSRPSLVAKRTLTRSPHRQNLSVIEFQRNSWIARTNMLRRRSQALEENSKSIQPQVSEFVNCSGGHSCCGQSPPKAEAKQDPRRVQTAAGRGPIPLDPLLIKAGFTEFVRDQQHVAPKQLFRELRPDRHSFWSASIAKRLNRSGVPE
jgi:hypothetical protein